MRFWWNQVGPILAAEIRSCRVSALRSSHWPCHLDERFGKIRGQAHYSVPITRMCRVLGVSRRFKRTTDSEHAWPVAPNLVGQDFAAEASGRKWRADISYI